MGCRTYGSIKNDTRLSGVDYNRALLTTANKQSVVSSYRSCGPNLMPKYNPPIVLPDLACPYPAAFSWFLPVAAHGYSKLVAK